MVCAEETGTKDMKHLKRVGNLQMRNVKIQNISFNIH